MEIENSSVNQFLDSLRPKLPDNLKPYADDFKARHNNRLWHQLTCSVSEFFKHPEAKPFCVDLYENFISEWKDKINQINHILFAIEAAEQLKAQDLTRAYEFMQRVLKPFEDADRQSLENEDAQRLSHEKQNAYILSLLESASIKLLMLDLDYTRNTLRDCERRMDLVDHVNPTIYSYFYRLSSDYYKAQAKYTEFYKNALLFLACVDLSHLSFEVKSQYAYDLCLAALLSSKIYNFGKLLDHEIITDPQTGGKSEWANEHLYNIIYEFNRGDVSKYDILEVVFNQHPLLAQNKPLLRQKMRQMALMKVLFEHPTMKSQHQISFEVIQQRLRCSKDEVEHLVMKSLALGLIRGTIDEVAQVVTIDWVQPRHLGRDDVRAVIDKLQQWQDTLDDMASNLRETAPSLFVD
ncbi:26S proteasome regulatory subunit [Spiromyces aspiralis]|uniref:26S proteasome regulatory subunit n=1 Tax=Spiromyces aspiralis TaxID=68401 RepID=A0ACC1HHE4_9FUNG|nr:26S proteasome regulatory subunit [Spiromyces aspiralis]